MIPTKPLVARHLIVHLFVKMLLLLTLHDGGGADGSEILGVDGTIVIGKTTGSSAEQFTRMGL